jgi:heme-degrading monooxygenase HmoA
MWKGRASAEKAAAYARHAMERVFPGLSAMQGHRGAYLLRRTVDGAVEFVVLTLWSSMEAIRKFAGTEPDRAVVEPGAKAALTEFDPMVTHFDVVCDTVRVKSKGP